MVVIDERDKRVLDKRLGNDLSATLEVLSPYRDTLKGVAVESTFNWYRRLCGALKRQGRELSALIQMGDPIYSPHLFLFCCPGLFLLFTNVCNFLIVAMFSFLGLKKLRCSYQSTELSIPIVARVKLR